MKKTKLKELSIKISIPWMFLQIINDIFILLCFIFFVRMLVEKYKLNPHLFKREEEIFGLKNPKKNKISKIFIVFKLSFSFLE